MRLTLLVTLPLFLACNSDKEDDTSAGTDTSTESGESGDSAEDATPVSDPSSLVGRTYGFKFGDATIAEPAALGAIIASYVTAPVMVGVTASDSSSIDLLGGLGVADSDPAEQDACVPTFDFPASSFGTNPDFSAGPTDASLSIGASVPVYGLTLTGRFAEDGSDIHNGTFTGLVDTRPIGPLLSGGGGDDAVCLAAKNFAISCVDCPGDVGTFCLNLVAEDITWLPGQGTMAASAGCE